MAHFTIEIADADIERVTEALSQAGGFTDPSEENALSTVMTFVQQTVMNVETANARVKALATVTPIAPIVLNPVTVSAEKTSSPVASDVTITP